MSTPTLSLPPIPLQYLDAGVLRADFYSYIDLLTAPQRKTLDGMREFFRANVIPIVDDHWARAEFPHQLVSGFAGLGLIDWADPDSAEQAPSNLMKGFTTLELAHADASMATFFGVHTGLAIGGIR